MNSELHWFHFGCPLMLLLLYNAVASLRRNQVGLPTACCDTLLFLSNGQHVLEQLVGGALGQNAERADSTASQSYDMTTATSDLSDEVTSTMTAETRRQLWRRTHHQVRPLESLPSKKILHWPTVTFSVHSPTCPQPMTAPQDPLLHPLRAQPWDLTFTKHLTTP